jgi:hypothetical protein
MMMNSDEKLFDFTELINVYLNILEITENINKLTETDNLQDIPSLLRLRGDLINKSIKTTQKTVLSDTEKAEIKSLKEKIQIIDEKNIKTLEEKKTEIKKSLFGISVNKKNISAYKLNDISEPRLFDETE